MLTQVLKSSEPRGPTALLDSHSLQRLMILVTLFPLYSARTCPASSDATAPALSPGTAVKSQAPFPWSLPQRHQSVLLGAPKPLLGRAEPALAAQSFPTGPLQLPRVSPARDPTKDAVPG